MVRLTPKRPAEPEATVTPFVLSTTKKGKNGDTRMWTKWLVGSAGTAAVEQTEFLTPPTQQVLEAARAGSDAPSTTAPMARPRKAAMNLVFMIVSSRCC